MKRILIIIYLFLGSSIYSQDLARLYWENPISFEYVSLTNCKMKIITDSNDKILGTEFFEYSVDNKPDTFWRTGPFFNEIYQKYYYMDNKLIKIIQSEYDSSEKFTFNEENYRDLLTVEWEQNVQSFNIFDKDGFETDASFHIIYENIQNRVIEKITYGYGAFYGTTCFFVRTDDNIEYTCNFTVTGTMEAYLNNISQYIYTENNILSMVKIYNKKENINFDKYLDSNMCQEYVLEEIFAFVDTIKDMDYSLLVSYIYDTY